MKFDLSKTFLLQAVIDTLNCDDDFGKKVIDALIENGEEFTEKTVIEYGEKMAGDNVAIHALKIIPYKGQYAVATHRGEILHSEIRLIESAELIKKSMEAK